MSGRKPLGERAMTPAERQARYRARIAERGPVAIIRYRRPKDRRSRAQRWIDAVAELMQLQEEYQAWLDALPASLEGSAIAERLRAISEYNLSELSDLEPPRGFGRD